MKCGLEWIFFSHLQGRGFCDVLSTCVAADDVRFGNRIVFVFRCLLFFISNFIAAIVWVDNRCVVRFGFLQSNIGNSFSFIQ